MKYLLSKKISIGQVVKGKSGREEGNLFFVINIVNDDYVYISDGKKRKLVKPKLKKVKHLEIYDIINSDIKQKIITGSKITDKFLRTQLNKLDG